MTPKLPPSSINCSPSPISVSLLLKLQSDNNLPIIPFTQQEYSNAKAAQAVTVVLQAGSYIVLAASVISCKVVGLQLFGVLQLAFFTLGDNDDVNLLLSGFLDAKALNGFNFKISNESNKGKRTSSAKLNKIQSRQTNRILQSMQLAFQAEEVPSRVNALGFQSPLFIDNCNIMLAIIVAQIIIAFILFLFTKCLHGSKFKTIYKIAKFLMQQVFLTLILFNCFNIAFSASVHFTYATGNQEMYLISSIMAICALMIPLSMIVILLCADSKQFGEFKNKFKKDCPSQTYFSIMIIYRCGLGMYIAAMNEYDISTLIATFFSIAVLMYTLINLPFKDAYQNYRAVLCNTTIMIVLFVTMYYRSMKSNIQPEERAVIYAPAIIELTAIFLCMVVSIIVLLYQIYVFIKKCCKKKNKKRSSKISNVFSEQSKSANNNETEFDMQADQSGQKLDQSVIQTRRNQYEKQPNIVFNQYQPNQKLNNYKDSIEIEHNFKFEDM